MQLPRDSLTEYQVHVLRDSIFITSEPGRTDRVFRCGVSHVQSCTVVEGSFNMAAVWAFSHPNILSLAYSNKKTEINR